MKVKQFICLLYMYLNSILYDFMIRKELLKQLDFREFETNNT